MNADTLAGFASFAKKLQIEDGTPLTLYPAQREILRDYFAGARETVVIIGKGNGKTTELAANALHHLTVTPHAEVIIAAASQEQAAIMYRQARMLLSSGEQVGKDSWRIGSDVFKVQQGYFVITHRNGRIRVLPGDPRTADGVIPTLAIVDELHRHRSDELYAILKFALNKRDGRMITISTAGVRLDSPLGRLRDRARALDGVQRVGAHTFVRAEDFVYHEWALDADEDPSNMRHVKRANPAPWHTMRSLQAAYASPTTVPSQWARFVCGLWGFLDDPLFSEEVWDACRVDVGGVQEGEVVYAALNAGASSCSIALGAPRDDGRVAVRLVHLNGVTDTEIERTVVHLSTRFHFRRVSYDRLRFQYMAERLEAFGIPMIEVPHSPERLAICSTTFHRLVAGKALLHDGDITLRRQALRAITKESERGWRLVKTSDNHALIAAALAVHDASMNEDGGPYLWMGDANAAS